MTWVQILEGGFVADVDLKCTPSPFCPSMGGQEARFPPLRVEKAVKHQALPPTMLYFCLISLSYVFILFLRKSAWGIKGVWVNRGAFIHSSILWVNVHWARVCQELCSAAGLSSLASLWEYLSAPLMQAVTIYIFLSEIRGKSFLFLKDLKIPLGKGNECKAI